MPEEPLGHEEEEISGWKLESPVAEYGTKRPAEDAWMAVLTELGVGATEGGKLQQVREVLRRGLPREVFERLRQTLGVPAEELADVLGIPLRTLARRTERFKRDESERLLRVWAVVHMALALVEEPAALQRWMTQPKRALGGLSPLRCCDTELGAREVEALLGRIAHGVFS